MPDAVLGSLRGRLASPGIATGWSAERGRVRVAIAELTAALTPTPNAANHSDTNPSPPAFARLQRGRQSSPLQKGRGEKDLSDRN